MPNPWDAGSARLLAGLGFEALATTSSGFAHSLGRLDGDVASTEMIEHCRKLRCRGRINRRLQRRRVQPDLCVRSGSRACSCGRRSGQIARFSFYIDRARRKSVVGQTRSQRYDTIRRLQAFESAGADALYAPGHPALACKTSGGVNIKHTAAHSDERQNGKSKDRQNNERSSALNNRRRRWAYV